MPRPPRLIREALRRILWRVLPAPDRRDLFETLERLYTRRRKEDGVLRANAWYLWQAVDFAVRLSVERIRRRRPRASSTGWASLGSRSTGETVMNGWLQDLRHTVRRLTRTPAASVAVIVSLALAVGANGAIFGTIERLLLDPLPYHQANRLVKVWGTYPEKGGGQYSLSYPNYQDFAKASALDGLAAYRVRSYTLSGLDRPERVVGVAATANLFRVLGVQPVLGRDFRDDEDGAGGDRVAVLSYGLWQRTFGGRRDVLGRAVTLDGEPYTVVGVMSRGFSFPLEEGALWVPLLRDESNWHRASGGLSTVGRLAPGAGVEELQSQIRQIAGPIARDWARWYEGWTGLTMTLPRAVYGEEVRLMLYALVAAVGLLLLTACINLANLLLARATSRRREIAVRSALGAGRRRVVRLFLMESLTLGAAGGALGLMGAWAGIHFLRTDAPSGIPRIQDLTMDPMVAGFTLVLGVLVGILFGLVPALRGARTDVATILQRGIRGQTEGRGGRRLQRVLIAAQVGLVLTVLTCAGLMVRTVGRLGTVALGFHPERVTAFSVSLTSEYDQPDEVSRFQDQVLQKLRNVPGVRAAGVVNSLPLTGTENLWDIIVEDGPQAGQGGERRTGANYAGPGYFGALGIPVLEGRGFNELDRARTEPVAVVTKAMANHFWPGESAVGKRVALPGESAPDHAAWRTVVGVVGDVRQSDLRRDPRGQMYVPWAQIRYAEDDMDFVVDVGDGVQGLARTIRETVRSVDPGQAVFGIMPMRDVVAAQMADSRGLAWLLALFGGVALVLASVGVFGVVAHAVAQRRHEIGVRAALGAARERVLGMVIWQGLTPVVLGLVLGLPATLFVTRFLKRILFQVDPLDPATISSVSAGLLLVSMVAVWLPARRATAVDPVETLKEE